MLALAQQLSGRATPLRVLLLTCGLFALSGAPSDAAQGGAWGLARSARAEAVQLQARLKASEEEKAALVEKLESRRVEYDEEHRCAVPAFPDAQP